MLASLAASALTSTSKESTRMRERGKVRMALREDGSAITEFVICAPVFIMLIFYSAFFADLTLVKLKTLELARFVTWEKTVHRTVVQIEADALKRFENLRLGDDAPGPPNFLFGVSIVPGSISVVLDDEVHTQMTGTVKSNPNSFSGGVMGMLGGFLGKVDGGIGWALDKFKFNTDGTVEATVKIEVENSLIPDALLQHIHLLDDRLKTTITFESSQALVFDTWKAWPQPSSPLGGKFTSVDTDPMDTYPVAEEMTSKQLEYLAYLGVNRFKLMKGLEKVFNLLELPPPFSSARSTEGGPTVMWPTEAKTPLAYSPSHHSKLAKWQGGFKGKRGSQRLGHFSSDQAQPGYQPWSPIKGVDRFRYTLPYTFNTPKWDDAGEGWFGGPKWGPLEFDGDGGYGHKPLKNLDKETHYKLTWGCRGHFYYGSIDPEDELFDGCTLVDNVPIFGWAWFKDKAKAFFSSLPDLL